MEVSDGAGVGDPGHQDGRALGDPGQHLAHRPVGRAHRPPPRLPVQIAAGPGPGDLAGFGDDQCVRREVGQRGGRGGVRRDPAGSVGGGEGGSRADRRDLPPAALTASARSPSRALNGLDRCAATSAGQPGTDAVPSPAATGAGIAPQPEPGEAARWPAETVSHPAAGQVTGRPSGGTARVDSDAVEPRSARAHNVGVRSGSRSAQRSPGTPITTTRPTGVVAPAGTVPPPARSRRRPGRKRRAGRGPRREASAQPPGAPAPREHPDHDGRPPAPGAGLGSPSRRRGPAGRRNLPGPAPVLVRMALFQAPS